ncbi:2,5-dichloro-2,5-cyclohexadiene-1,4-diol dehydrogenase-like isoform X2 [Liolophura sinensis]|uniref:2,5-dichloro-2,5-cyclohexadiene-1,4-diol dehydrogenase-like isoform X2 n=1 Tax=Liolophura sinensis TaxID=3198878 RepID=UPI003158518A
MIPRGRRFTTYLRGGASGIGRATVERFLNDGATVAVFDINEDAGRSVLEWTEGKNYTVSFHNVDVSQRTQCDAGVADVVKKHGEHIHCLVNSAVYFGSKALNSKKSDWDKTMSVNVVGYVNMVQACHPYMKATGVQLIHACTYRSGTHKGDNMAAEYLSENQPALNQSHTLGRFRGYTVIVTGGASGIGRATVERFLNDGATVAVFDINEDAGRSVLEWAEGKNYTVSFHNVDVSQRTQCDAGVADVVKKHGEHIHCLVNSAVYFGSKALASQRSDWEKTMSVNVIGYVNMIQASHSYMKNTGGSSIVNLSSISAHRAQPIRWTYTASKGAILSMTKCMALDLAADGIRVNSVSPAWIWTPEAAKSVGGDKGKQNHTVSRFHMLRRTGETSEVAAGITFLCSRDAAFITGTDLAVDGGYLAMGPEQHGEESAFAGTEL